MQPPQIPLVNLRGHYQWLRQQYNAKTAQERVAQLADCSVNSVRQYVTPSHKELADHLERKASVNLFVQYILGNPDASLNDYIEHCRQDRTDLYHR